MRLIRLFAAVLSVVLTLGAGAATAQTLNTGAVANNGNDGVMFDVTATNAVTVTALSTDVSTAGTFEVWTRSGTHVGFEESTVGWTLLGSGAAATGFNQPIPVVLSVPISAGQTQAFLITGVGGASLNYMDGTALGAVQASDANISILEGTGKSGGLTPGNTFVPRVLVGSVTYTLGAVATVPTMTEWAMILFALLLAGGAALHLQRRRLQS